MYTEPKNHTDSPEEQKKRDYFRGPFIREMTDNPLWLIPFFGAIIFVVVILVHCL